MKLRSWPIWKIEYGTGLTVTTTDAQYLTVLGEAETAGAYTGGVSAFIPTDPTATQQMIVQTAAVPEPSTWAMMLVGFAGVVFMGMRKRRESKFPDRLMQTAAVSLHLLPSLEAGRRLFLPLL